MLTTLWFVVIGFLLANGVPHFVAGAAGKIFRSPFGRHSSAKTNFGWGLSNFIIATLLVVWRISERAPHKGEWIALLIGFWLAIAVFGANAKSFFDERGTAVEQIKPAA